MIKGGFRNDFYRFIVKRRLFSYHDGGFPLTYIVLYSTDDIFYP